VTQDSDIKAVNIYKFTCTHVGPCIVMMDENLLHIRRNSIDTCFQFLNLLLQYLEVVLGSLDMNSRCIMPLINSSLSAFFKGIFIGMQKDFNSVRRYNISRGVLQWHYSSNSVKNMCVCSFVHKNLRMLLPYVLVS
jgi:hypothetical protein